MKISPILTTCLIPIFLTACNLAPVPGTTGTSSALPTVEPDQTIEPLPVAAEILTEVTAVSYDPFDNMNRWTFQCKTGALTNGIFQLNGTAP
jgi:hypothetical protein